MYIPLGLFQSNFITWVVTAVNFIAMATALFTINLYFGSVPAIAAGVAYAAISTLQYTMQSVTYMIGVPEDMMDDDDE